MTTSTHIIYCENELKKNDYYRYICCLFAPKHIRENLLALYAFNFEISKIKDITSEPMTGLIRITWWVEAINEIYSNHKIREHEVVKALNDVIKSTNIPRDIFEHMIFARETDLSLKPLETIDDFNKYINDTAGNLLKASLYITANTNDENLLAATHIASAYAIVGIMRSIKWNIPKKQIFLPIEILQKHYIDLDEISEGKNLESFKPLVKELCSMAASHLTAASLTNKSLKTKSMPIYLHSIIAKVFLGRIAKNNYDLFHSDLEDGKFMMLLKLYFAARF